MACPLGCRDEKGEVSRVERREVETHRTCCPMRNFKCEYCSDSAKACDMNGHLEVCEEFPIPCPNKCSEEFRVKGKEKSIHLRQECPLQETECPYSQYGCEVKFQRRNLEQHEKEDMHKHMKLTINMISDVQILVESMQNKIVKLEEENEVFRKLIPRGSLEWKIGGIRNKISENKNSYSDPFYVGLYKFQGRVEWLCGDNCVGLFLCIMKGKWDDALKWPVQYKFSMILINQLDNKNNYEINYEMTEEDLRRLPECFVKPSAEKNRSFGYTEFVSHADLLLEEYSKGDSIMLKISVELILDP